MNIYAERELLQELILFRNRFEIVAKLLAVHQGRININEVAEQYQLNASYIEKAAGGGIVLPGIPA